MVEPRNSGVRVLGLGALSVGAFLTAVAIERFSGVLASRSETVWAAIFLPLTSIVGGRVVFGSAGALLFGLAFWPVAAWLGWRWMRHGPQRSVAAALGVWLMFGFAHPVTRFGLIMSA